MTMETMSSVLKKLSTFKLPVDLFQEILAHVHKGLLGLSLLIVIIGTAFVFFARQEISLPSVSKVKTHLPKNSFQKEQESYESIGKGLFALSYVAPKMHLPDLKTHLVYFGQNGRPDVRLESPLLHFSIDGSKEIISARPKEKLFLQYQNQPGKYIFSPGNQETSLWIIPQSQEGEAVVLVGMLDENGQEVASPESNARFQLNEKEVARTLQTAWDIGKWKVDGTLLARQRARWMGQDKFLERHGGEEFKAKAGKTRIDFGEKDETYSVYVDAGDILGWKDDHFEAMEPSKESQKYPILVVKKVDERLMNLELWDVEGKKKLALNLLKSMETWMPNDIQQEFKFIGARTKSQYVFEVDSEKMLLSPYDWLLMTEDGWKKLSSADQIDDYVDRRMVGTLFVFEGIDREGDQQIMKGHLYNPARTLVQDIELAVQKEGLVYQPLKRDIKEKSSRHESYANGRLDKHRHSLRLKENNQEHIP